MCDIIGLKMESVVRYLNKLTDMDWGWWPLLHLRPEKDEDIDNIVLLKITPVFGTFATLIAILPNLPLSVQLSITVLLCCWVAFFVVYKFTFAAAWNKRARMLRGHDN